MRESQNPIAIRSQNMIYSAFIDLLSSMPYEDITVGALCKTADIDRRTFYRYFDNKNDVLHSYLNKIFDDYMIQVAELTSDNSMEYLKLFFSFFSNNYNDFLAALHRNASLAMAFMGNERYLAEVSRLINEKLNREDSQYATIFRASGFISVLAAWLGNGCKESVDEMVATVIKVLR